MPSQGLVCLVTGANRQGAASRSRSRRGDYYLFTLVVVLMFAIDLASSFPTPTPGTSVVLGANRGIGLELCRQLAGRGDKVFAVCRKPSPELQQLNLEGIIDGIDVASDEQVAGLGQRLGGVRVDQLWCNAGILHEDNLENLDFDRLRQQFEVNTLGPLRVVKALLPSLSKGSKVLLVTSLMGSMDDNGSGEYYGYRMSKAGLNMAGKSMSLDLKPKGISVLLLHPGFVRTDMTARYGDSSGMITPADSARGLITQADKLTIAKSGSFLRYNGDQLPW